ncbi:MAG: HEAT repeat domain-containing protein [Lentisphaerae bacterium]|jgi:HEAT repeat protein|nr:HEAT repeat domain-containing protein [Lentisphaerota bacterium]MBT4815396.1 HEAT repeat domain-containing protein [Lentisphaerota bacterium]MBT5611270.1 HEAT repeat domain-containing protein [Lentisphaerota bacterium]MBT7058413.1 HEAT repeat domain-containing protein [Lentisphaerota bacterium]MBT7846848.1 HEAT repeat domain-containing protein [Lentisphaerota bacterium]
MRSFIGFLLLALPLGQAAPSPSPSPLPDVLTEEISRFRRLMASASPQLRTEGIQGARLLRLQSFERDILPRLRDDVPSVRGEAAQALAVCGTSRAILPLATMLQESDWALKQRATQALRTLTGQTEMPADAGSWKTWWSETPPEASVQKLLAALSKNAPQAPPGAAQTIRALATQADEAGILAVLTGTKGLPGAQRKSLTEALDRVGSKASLPYFCQRASVGDRAAAWALGTRPGPDSEAALLKGLRRSHSLDFLLNLDRLHSTACAPFIPRLCRNFYSVIRAGFGEDIRYPPSPMRRVSANLIRRTGRGDELVDMTLRQMERELKPEEIPAGLKPLFADLRKILNPEFLREGYSGCDPMLGALHDVARDPAITPRLIALLSNECLLVRIYAALTLGRLQAREGVAPILAVIRKGYAFSDVTAMASAKHTADVRKVAGKRVRQSQTVRWLGYLCVALGHIGSEDARVALEEFARASNSPRDVRYGSVVALGVLGSRKSLPALESVARNDIIWMIRDVAGQTVENIRLGTP